MTSAAGDVLPALPPIRTTAAAEVDARPSPAASSSSTAAPGEREEAEPTTPTSEQSRLRPPTECPPAPPPGAKRRFPSASTRAFFPVARDLSAVFRPKKRIRAG